MAFPFMLLATQAAGIGMNLYARNKAKKYEEMGMQYSRMGAQLEANEMGLRMEQEVLASKEQSLMSTENLREVLASQRAIFASRGTKAGQGSAHGVQEKSIRTYNADERARKLSLDFKKQTFQNQLKLRQIGLKGQEIGMKANRKAKDFSSLVNGIQGLDINSMFGEQQGFSQFFGIQ